MSNEYCIPITKDIWGSQKQDVALIGGKARGIAALLAAELEVPRAVVLTTTAYHHHLKNHPRIVEAIRKVTNDPKVLNEIQRAFEASDLDSVLVSVLQNYSSALQEPLAVRSSAVVEDAYEASWAGQFRTQLNVRQTGLGRSLISCWASLYSSASISYAKRQGVSLEKTAMAVVIQELVDARLSGVLFSGVNVQREPDDDVAIIEYVRGFGESLVSGHAVPEGSFQVNLTTNPGELSFVQAVPRLRPHGNGIPPAGLQALVNGTRSLQEFFQCTRLDIEWTWDGTKLSFLQVRPIAFS